jgi:hypothetical protein
VPEVIAGPPYSWRDTNARTSHPPGGGVSIESILYDCGSFATLMCNAKYISVLSSERAPYMKKQVIVRQKKN